MIPQWAKSTQAKLSVKHLISYFIKGEDKKAQIEIHNEKTKWKIEYPNFMFFSEYISVINSNTFHINKILIQYTKSFIFRRRGRRRRVIPTLRNIIKIKRLYLWKFNILVLLLWHFRLLNWSWLLNWNCWLLNRHYWLLNRHWWLLNRYCWLLNRHCWLLNWHCWLFDWNWYSWLLNWNWNSW